MTKIFKNNNQPLFVSKRDKIKKRGSFAVILSPEFYWVKKVKLPVQKEKEALRLAASVYEDSLPQGAYTYATRKSGDEFIMIAYDKKEIAKALDTIFAHKTDIKELYFAQDALIHLRSCVSVNDTLALSNMDSVIIQVPRACTNTVETLEKVMQNATLGKNKIKLSSFDKTLLSSSDIKWLVVLFVLLLVAFMSEYIVYKKAASSLEAKRAEIIAQNDLPPTSIQLKSIKKSLMKKYKSQKKLRDMLALVAKLHLKDGEYIESIEEDTSSLTLKIHLLSKEREHSIVSSLPKSITLKESYMRENSLILKIVS